MTQREGQPRTMSSGRPWRTRHVAPRRGRQEHLFGCGEVAGAPWWARSSAPCRLLTRDVDEDTSAILSRTMARRRGCVPGSSLPSQRQIASETRCRARETLTVEPRAVGLKIGAWVRLVRTTSAVRLRPGAGTGTRTPPRPASIDRNRLLPGKAARPPGRTPPPASGRPRNRTRSTHRGRVIDDGPSMSVQTRRPERRDSTGGRSPRAATRISSAATRPRASCSPATWRVRLTSGPGPEGPRRWLRESVQMVAPPDPAASLPKPQRRMPAVACRTRPTTPRATADAAHSPPHLTAPRRQRRGQLAHHH
jgi:hypothetical protein